MTSVTILRLEDLPHVRLEDAPNVKGRALKRSMTIALALVALSGCQAPGFMGLNGSATTPDALADGSHLARARFRVLVPSEFAQGVALAPATEPEASRSSMRADDRAVVGARVFLDAQPSVSDTTDDLGYASLALPQGHLTPVRAEFKTANGTVSMTSLVMIGPEAEAAPVFPITLASTLVMSKLAQRFSFSDLGFLPYDRIQADTIVVDRALRGADGAYDPRYLGSLPRQWTVLDTVRAMTLVDPLLGAALADVLAIRVAPEASPSLSASGSVPLATSSANASGSLVPTPVASASSTGSLAASDATPSLSADETWFPAEPGQRWTYDLVDSEGQPLGTFTRVIAKATPKADGLVLTGRESGEWAGVNHPLTFLMKRSPERIEFSAAYRPAVIYPLPLVDGRTWEAATGIRAVAHAQAASDGSWRIDFTREVAGKTQSWREWLAPGVGFTRFEWMDARSGARFEARLHRKHPATPVP